LERVLSLNKRLHTEGDRERVSVGLRTHEEHKLFPRNAFLGRGRGLLARD
jgi:hypothetical protein